MNLESRPQTISLEQSLAAMQDSDEIKLEAERSLCAFASASALDGFSEAAVMAIAEQLYSKFVAKRIHEWLKSTDQPGPDALVDPLAESVIRIATMMAVRRAYRFAKSKL